MSTSVLLECLKEPDFIFFGFEGWWMTLLIFFYEFVEEYLEFDYVFWSFILWI